MKIAAVIVITIAPVSSNFRYPAGNQKQADAAEGRKCAACVPVSVHRRNSAGRESLTTRSSGPHSSISERKQQ